MSEIQWYNADDIGKKVAFGKRNRRSGKLGVEGVEAGKGGRGEFRHGGYDSFERFLFHVTAFGVEFVGIADEAFKQGLRQIVPDRNGKS